MGAWTKEQTKKGKELEFISRINRDGSGTTEVSEKEIKANENTNFTMNSLSISNDTWIACEFNSYVVRLK